MLRVPVLFALACVGLVAGQGYETFQGLTNSYRLHTERVPWVTADRVCRMEGGHLLVLNSEDEAAVSNLLFGRLAPFDPPLAWRYDLMHVGITDRTREGDWRTVLGDTLAAAGYNVWRPSEPNNYARAEHCGAIARVGEFSDLRCNHVEHLCPFVCEKEGVDDDQGPASDFDVRSANSG